MFKKKGPANVPPPQMEAPPPGQVVLDQEMVPVQSAPQPQINLLPKQADGGGKAKQGASIGGFMKNIMGGSQPDGQDEGLLDNHHAAGAPMAGGGGVMADHNDRPSDIAAKNTPKNQDLWLLNLFFKGCALLVYFFLPIVFPETLAYILVLMLSSIDFWVVKNIVGRKLVKMRWWFIIDNEGNERWHYESKECTLLFQDKLVFWGTLYLTPAVWLLFCVMNAITFAIFKTATTAICLLIAAVQYWGFKNCKQAHERKMKILSRRRAKGYFGQSKQNIGSDLKEQLLPPGGRGQQQKNANYRQ